MKKKILIPAFALVLALCLSACSGREFEIKHPGEEQSGALSENSELEHGEEESAAPEQGETSESQTSAAEETEKTPAPTPEEAYCEPIETAGGLPFLPIRRGLFPCSGGFFRKGANDFGGDKHCGKGSALCGGGYSRKIRDYPKILRHRGF